jgi:lysine 2,3-aminomutase
MEHMIGHTTGFARPQYVVDAPGGGGKIPVMPQTIISTAPGKVVLRNFEGVITTYQEPDTYPPDACDRNCYDCQLELNLEPGNEYSATGIAGLLTAQEEEDISLTPMHTERVERRK